jgi:hypothetical protein
LTSGPEANNAAEQAWEKAYRNAINESDPSKLAGKVMAAETAIFERSKEIRQSADDNTEKKAIRDALDALLAIKNEKLNFPGWNSKGGPRP